MPFDVTALATLNRTTLQRLAKEHQIKANLRSKVIIQLLTERHAEYTKASRYGTRATGSTGLKPSRRKSTVSPQSPLSSGHEFSSPEGHIDSHTRCPPGVQDFQGNPLQRPQTPSDRSAYTFATPESSVVGTPEREAAPELLRSTVEIIAGLVETDRQTAEKIRNLRLVVEMLRKKTTDMQGLLKAERAMRRRLEAFCVHWVKINPRWTFDEVWAGELRVRNMHAAREVTTSSEDES